MLVKSSDLLSKAKRMGYAVGAFNICSCEFIQAVAEAAHEENAPVIIQVTWDVLENLGIDYVSKVTRAASEDNPIPISLHLDHGHDLIHILKVIKAGFQSVMYDGSKLTLEKNISSTKKVCQIAHDLGVSVEAQLGTIPSSTDAASVCRLTNASEAAKFVDETKVDALSIAVGNIHGKSEGKTELRIDLIEEIAKLTDAPLVLHGGTGISDEDVKEVIRLGVSKINVGTATRNAYRTELRNMLTSVPNIGVNELLLSLRKAMKDVIRAKILLFGSSGHAHDFWSYEDRSSRSSYNISLD